MVEMEKMAKMGAMGDVGQAEEEMVWAGLEAMVVTVEMAVMAVKEELFWYTFIPMPVHSKIKSTPSQKVEHQARLAELEVAGWEVRVPSMGLTVLME
jgi:hypothetical protein